MGANLSMICLGLALGAALAAGGYFALRYFLQKKALREMDGELREICGELEENRILRLPIPDGTLARLMESVNLLLEEVRRERLGFLRREREFQEQIENISHDLRTPLTVILGYLRLLQRSSGPWPEISGRAQEKSGEPETARRFPGALREPEGSTEGPNAMPGLEETLEIMERNARAMEKLVMQFYAYSQVSGGDYAVELEDVDVCKELREALADNYRLLEKLTLTVRLPEHPVTVRGNREALERIFQNLFQNAGRYARSFLRIYMEEPAKAYPMVRIVMINDGERITEEEVSHIFDRFYRGDGARSKGGSGLGLAIARSLAAALGGSLAAEAVKTGPETEEPFGECGRETGDGTAICFTLLLAAAEEKR